MHNSRPMCNEWQKQTNKHNNNCTSFLFKNKPKKIVRSFKQALQFDLWPLIKYSIL